MTFILAYRNLREKQVEFGYFIKGNEGKKESIKEEPSMTHTPDLLTTIKENEKINNWS